jgi:hypothetical protein
MNLSWNKIGTDTFMKNRTLAMRMVLFLSLYLLVYYIPTVAIHSVRHMPRLIGNYCLLFPQLMFPFDIMFWKKAPIITNDTIYFFVSACYLVILSMAFAYSTRSVKQKGWIILLGFGFTILSVGVLNCVLFVCGITVETLMP